MEENKDYIELYPSYWIYNAGIVGILRTLKEYKKNEGVDFYFRNGALHVPQNVWGELGSYYVEMMEKQFGGDWFVNNKVFGGKKAMIFPNNLNSSTLNKIRKESGSKLINTIYEKNLYDEIVKAKWSSLIRTIDDMETLIKFESDIIDIKEFNTRLQMEFLPNVIRNFLNGIKNKTKLKEELFKESDVYNEYQEIRKKIVDFVDKSLTNEVEIRFNQELKIIEDSIDWTGLSDLLNETKDFFDLSLKKKDDKKAEDIRNINDCVSEIRKNDYSYLVKEKFKKIYEDIDLLNVIEKYFSNIKDVYSELKSDWKDEDIKKMPKVSVPDKSILKKNIKRLKEFVQLPHEQILRRIEEFKMQQMKINLLDIISEIEDVQEIKNLKDFLRNKIIKYAFNNLFHQKEKKGRRNFQCSFCGKETKKDEVFGSKWFAYEGGGKGFYNFLWKGSSQLPICNNSKLVLFFSPLGIFPDSNTEKGEFINIPDVCFLWELNNYRMKAYYTREGEYWLKSNERSKLIDSIVSTGAYLQLKSRWLLQNVEIIEIGGRRDKTVYNLELSTKVLNLLGDHASRSIPFWLNQIEFINIKKAPDNPDAKAKKNSILTKKFTGFTTGREIVERFLKNDTGWLNKISVLLFKLYFEINKNKEPLNDFKRLIDKSLKPLLLLNLSLLHGKEVFSEFHKLGHSIGGLFKSRDEKDRFKNAILPPLFSCVYTLRKENFVELLMKIYMEYQIEVDVGLVKILKLIDIEFQVESLSLLIGILEKIHYGEKDE